MGTIILHSILVHDAFGIETGGGQFNIFGTGYVRLGRVSISPFLVPSRVSSSAKGYTISKSLSSDRTTMVILLPDRVFELRKMPPDRVKITAPQRHTPVHIRTNYTPGEERRLE